MAQRRKCRYEPCGQMFEARNRHHNFCCCSCSMRARGPAWFKARTEKAAATRKAIGYTKVLARLKAAGVPDAAMGICRQEFERRYCAGHAKGRDTGYRKGFADALGERDEIGVVYGRTLGRLAPRPEATT